MVNYRLAQEEDYQKINDFYNTIYKSNRTIEQFMWEFHRGPFGKSIYVIACDGSRIVGTNCVIPIDLIDSNGRVVKSGKSEDTLVDPDYRGQKIFYKIYEFLFEKCIEANISIIWGFTTARKPFKSLGFITPYDQQQSLAVNKVWKSYNYLSSLNSKNSILDKIKIFGLCTLAKLRSIGKFKTKGSEYTIKRDVNILVGIPELIVANHSYVDSFFAIHQTPEFQKWRIYENPNYHKVHSFGVYKNNELHALFVFNSHANKVAFGCQVNFRSSVSEESRINLLKTVTRMLFNEGVILVRDWHFESNTVNIEEISVFKKAGYTHLKRGNALVWKNLSNIDLDPKDFHLSRIATQGVI